jgi:DNA-binding transcriptional regulator YiaG
MTHRDFAKTLVAWREMNNYTQRTAADMLGVSKRSLENWEQERAMPQGFGLKSMLKLIQGMKANPNVKPQRTRTTRRKKR